MMSVMNYRIGINNSYDVMVLTALSRRDMDGFGFYFLENNV